MLAIQIKDIKTFMSKLLSADIRVKLDDRSESMGYKIREALQDNKIPYVLVMGDKEKESGQVAVRIRGIGESGSMNIDDFIKIAKEKIETKTQELSIV